MRSFFLCLALLGGALGCGGNVETSAGAGARPNAFGTGTAAGFVAVGRREIAMSPDGVRWESRPHEQSFTPVASAGGAGRIVMLGFAQSAVPIQMVGVTADLRTWRATQVASGDCSLSDIAFVGGRFVAIGASWNTGSCAFESTDGETWRSIPNPPRSAMLRALVRGTDQIIASASSRSDLMIPMAFRVAGTDFVKIGETDRNVSTFVDAEALADGRIALVNGDGDVLSWDDPTTYAPVVDGAGTTDVSWKRIARGSGKLVVVGSSSRPGGGAVGVRDEARGSALEISLQRERDTLAGVAHGAGRFVVVGASFIAHSTDGRSWIEASGPTESWVSVTAIAPPP